VDIWQAIFLFFAALLGGTLNSVAGGGSFISFPALLFTGVPPIAANATNTVALWPGTVASTWAYRKELNEYRAQLPILSIVSLTGGLAGALLLLATPEATFETLIPWLLLVATLLFTFGWKVVAILRKKFGKKAPAPTNDAEKLAPDIKQSPRQAIATAAFQFIVAIYGGFFGGGIGIIMLALFTLLGMTNIHAMNGLKTLLASAINGVAVVTFVIAGAIVWGPGAVMIAGGITGGYGGAYFAQKLDPRIVRGAVIFVGFAMTAYFFWRTYF
jgi:uncharacterized protein